MAAGPRTSRRKGQGVVEIALVLPLLAMVILGSVEVSRTLNVYLTLHRVCRRVALRLAAPDITSSRGPEQGILYLRQELRQGRGWIDWKPAYLPAIGAMLQAPESARVRIQVNEWVEGTLHSEVEIDLPLAPLALPGFGSTHPVTLRGHGLSRNLSQAPRRNLAGEYQELELPLSWILKHPEEPLLPSSWER